MASSSNSILRRYAPWTSNGIAMHLKVFLSYLHSSGCIASTCSWNRCYLRICAANNNSGGHHGRWRLNSITDELVVPHADLLEQFGIVCGFVRHPNNLWTGKHAILGPDQISIIPIIHTQENSNLFSVFVLIILGMLEIYLFTKANNCMLTPMPSHQFVRCASAFPYPELIYDLSGPRG